MIEIKIDETKLSELINKHTVEINFNGFVMFKHKVVNARKLFEELHEVADCDKETFIDFVNTCNNPKTWMDREKYKENKMIHCLFHNVQSPGHFVMFGTENIGKDPYIEIKAIKDIIPLNL